LVLLAQLLESQRRGNSKGNEERICRWSFLFRRTFIFSFFFELDPVHTPLTRRLGGGTTSESLASLRYGTWIWECGLAGYPSLGTRSVGSACHAADSLWQVSRISPLCARARDGHI